MSAPSPPPTKASAEHRLKELYFVQGPNPPRVDIMTIPEESGAISKGTVRVTRLDAWTRFLAYEVYGRAVGNIIILVLLSRRLFKFASKRLWMGSLKRISL